MSQPGAYIAPRTVADDDKSGIVYHTIHKNYPYLVMEH